MAEVTGAHTVTGLSDILIVQPGESISVLLEVESAEAFEGTVSVDVSTDGGQTWPRAKSNGVPLTFTGPVDEGLEGEVFSGVVKNATTKIARYRVRAEVGAADGVSYTIADVAEESVVTVLKSPTGVPLLSVRDDGALVAEVPFASASMPGTIAPESITLAPGVEEFVDEVTISAADIVSTSAGKLGHAAGYPLLAAPGATKVAELVSVVMINDRAVAAYTAGGNLTINRTGGSAITGLVSAANSLGNAADTISLFTPLAAAAEVAAANVGFSLVSSAAFTNPGTAAGVLRLKVRYRLITTGLA